MDLLERFAGIRALVFDMDGVLTDGGLWLLSDGEWTRRMDIKDGYALQAAVKAGYTVAVVSGSVSIQVERRLRRLGVEEVHMDVSDKEEKLKEILDRHSIPISHALFMGDDLPDLGALRLVGIGCCPSDAAAEVREAADYISPYDGGRGSVRDVIERVMRAAGNWTSVPAARSI